ncbi:MAG TPA: S8 family serine peptidase [Armatimonadota bacterium]|jgi:subtilisin family serine protease
MRTPAILLALAFPSCAGTLSPRLAAAPPRGREAVIAYLDAPGGEVATISARKLRAHATQGPLLSAISRMDHGRVRALWIVNAVAIEAGPAAISAIAARTDVTLVDVDETGHADGGKPAAAPPWNLARIGADKLWAENLSGSGVTVGIIDTGLDALHPDLAGRLITGGWHDSVNGQTTPYDDNGHGTHVAGILCGGSASGTPIGVAPYARLLAAKALDAGARLQASWVIEAGQWMADPNGDSNPNDAPWAINCSWSFDSSITTAFRPVLQLWRSEGIVPVFAAGNAGPGRYSIESPASDPLALSVGMTNIFDAVADASGRGPAPPPAPFNENMKPDLVAPGVQIRSSLPGNRYGVDTGTSMAAPHVTGALALIRQDYPAITVEEAIQRVKATAADLGSPGADPNYGEGRLDVLAAAHASPVYQPAALTGVVLDSSGNPTRDAIVDAEGTLVLSGADGRFSIPHAAARSFIVSADAPGFGPAAAGGAPGSDIVLTLSPRIETAMRNGDVEAIDGWERGGAAGGADRVDTANRTPCGSWSLVIFATGDNSERYWLSPPVPVQSDGLAYYSVSYAWRGAGDVSGRTAALEWLDGYGSVIGLDYGTPFSPPVRGGPADGAWRGTIQAYRALPPVGAAWFRVRLGASYLSGDVTSMIGFDDVTVDEVRDPNAVAVSGSVTPSLGAVAGEFPMGARFVPADAAGRYVLLLAQGATAVGAWAPGSLPSALAAVAPPADGVDFHLAPAGPDLAPAAMHAASTTLEGSGPDLAADGSRDTYWSSAIGSLATPDDPVWWSMDLGAPRTLQSAEITWEAQPAEMRVLTSMDGVTWMPSASGEPLGWLRSVDHAMTVLDLHGVRARYLRVEDTQDSPEQRIALWEVAVRAERESVPGDADGDGVLSARDAAMALRMAGGLTPATPGASIGSGAVVDAMDATAVLRTVWGL